MASEWIPGDKLAAAPTAALVEQYEAMRASIASRALTPEQHGGQLSLRERRLRFIVDLLVDRAMAGDAEASAWLDERVPPVGVGGI